MSTQDPATQAHSNAMNALRVIDRGLMSRQRGYDAAKHGDACAAADAALAALRDAAPEHPALADLEGQLAVLRDKADEYEVGLVRDVFANAKRAIERELDGLRSERDRHQPAADCFNYSPASYAERIAGLIATPGAVLGGARGRLGSDRGRAFVRECEAWFVEVEAARATIQLAGEAVERIESAQASVPGRSSGISILVALKSVARTLDRNAPEEAALAWDAAKKLVTQFADRRFAEVHEVRHLLERYATLAARIESERLDAGGIVDS